jgi:hypothetical protein
VKNIKVTVMPKCGICGSSQGIYDAPTNGGSWGNMCEDCIKIHGDSNGIGSKREMRVSAKPQTDGKIVDAIEEFNRDTILMGEREVECPKCGETRMVEPDADYVYGCEGCGVKVRVRDIMESML